MQSQIVIHYPVEDGRIVLRTEDDWELDVEPTEVSEDGSRHEFLIESDEDVLELKICLLRGEERHWSVGENFFVPLGQGIRFERFPYFLSEEGGQVGDLVEIESKIGSPRRVRVYLPSGYEENTLARYPVIYMHDGANLFLPSEAFQGQEWEVDATMDALDRMHLIQRSIVVGIHSAERMDEYTDPGYEAYGLSVKEEIKPWVDEHHRTRTGPDDTFVIGSSLGGVVSFYMGWEWPETFGSVACLSSPFSYQDDLLRRVRSEPLGARRRLKVYLDSGWPKDNYEPTLNMAVALIGRGFLFGRDFLHCAFPTARHRERDWAERVHLPIQFFCGHLKRLSAAMHDARGEQER